MTTSQKWMFFVIGKANVIPWLEETQRKTGHCAEKIIEQFPAIDQVGCEGFSRQSRKETGINRFERAFAFSRWLLSQFQYLPIAFCQWPIDLVYGQVHKLPRFISFRSGKLIKPIPFLINLIRKFAFVLSCLLLYIRLRGGNYFSFGSVITRQSINEALNSCLGEAFTIT